MQTRSCFVVWLRNLIYLFIHSSTYICFIPRKCILINNSSFPPGYAPLLSAANAKFRAHGVQDLISQLFDSKSMMADCNPSFGKYLTGKSWLMSCVKNDTNLSAVIECMPILKIFSCLWNISLIFYLQY